ncbi:MAG: hypothetical protein J6P56_08270, partial [Bacteroidales bacterium]|nr:hypothetical protein [Bacteroidales bacterium]
VKNAIDKVQLAFLILAHQAADTSVTVHPAVNVNAAGAVDEAGFLDVIVGVSHYAGDVFFLGDNGTPDFDIANGGAAEDTERGSKFVFPVHIYGEGVAATVKKTLERNQFIVVRPFTQGISYRCGKRVFGCSQREVGNKFVVGIGLKFLVDSGGKEFPVVCVGNLVRIILGPVSAAVIFGGYKAPGGLSYGKEGEQG